MQDAFNTSAESLSGAEQALTEWNVPFERQPDGSIIVPGTVDISNRSLERLPDLSRVTVRGGFLCNKNKLVSLEGAPHAVEGGFDCSENRLTSLKGCPQQVGGFFCGRNELTSLEHGPASVKGDFDCDDNLLTSLQHGPVHVGACFHCNGNRLRSLEHGPVTVGFASTCSRNSLVTLKGAAASARSFTCVDNLLDALEHAPPDAELSTDFGRFPSWDAVPQHLRISQETLDGMEKERRDALDRDAYDATILQAATIVRGPLRFRPRFLFA